MVNISQIQFHLALILLAFEERGETRDIIISITKWGNLALGWLKPARQKEIPGFK